MKLQRLFIKVAVTAFLLSLHPVSSAVNSELNNSPPPQIAAAPSRVTVDVGRGRAGGSIRVFNLGDETVSISTSVQNWTMDSQNNIKVISPTPHSLDQSLIINPINFTIEPGKQQVVRYSVRPRSKPDDGEHRAMVFFNQVTNGPDEGTIDINFRMGVAIYGVAGDVQRIGQLHGLSVNQLNKTARIAADIESLGNGNVRLDGQISIWPEASFPDPATIPLYDLSIESGNTPDNLLAASLLNSLPVLPGTRRVVETSLELPDAPGNYMVHVIGTLGKDPINRTLPLSIR